jgi:tetratricopeptide (TPR) repeat protein
VAGRIGDRQGVANLQANIGNVHLARGEIAKAETAYEESRARFKSIGDHRGEAQALVAMGNVRFLSGEYQAAADCYREALKPRERMKDRYGLANALDNLGVAEYRNRAVGGGANPHASCPHHPGRTARPARSGRIGLNVGALYQVLGGTALARKLFNDSLNLSLEMGDAEHEVKARLLLAGLDLWKGTKPRRPST